MSGRCAPSSTRTSTPSTPASKCSTTLRCAASRSSSVAARRRGVVMAASYEAREYGVQSAMPLRTAGRRCPTRRLSAGRPDRYGELSQQVMAIFASYTPLVEPISLDEAFLDVTASEAAFGDGPTIARAIKHACWTKSAWSSRRRGDQQAVRQGRVRPAQARRAGRRGARPRGGVPGAAAHPASVGRRPESTEGARRLRRDHHRPAGGDGTVDPATTIRTPRPRPRGPRAGIDRGRVETMQAPKSVGHEHTFGVDSAERAASRRRCWILPNRWQVACGATTSPPGRSSSSCATRASRR